MSELTLPSGVRIRGDKLYIDFYYEGKRCRELIEGVAKLDAKAVRYAKNKRDSIKVEIAENRFNYRAHFPNSKKALEFAGALATDINRTVRDGVQMWLDVKEETSSDETMVGYRSKAKHVTDHFKDTPMRNIKTNDLVNFRKALRKKKKLGTKTINDVFTPLRGAFRLAKNEGVIQINPLEDLQNIKASEEDDVEADPYSESELARVVELKKDYPRQQFINMFIFTCWTGLRLSEALALAWEDVDLVKWQIRVRRARVGANYKAPKEIVSIRDIDLLQPAIDILKEQRALTYMREAVPINRKAINNVDVIAEKVRFVFMNDHPSCLDGLMKKKAVSDAYADILRKAKIRHRGANQCRHTFASMLMTRLVPLSLIYPIMGHASEEMLKKHYAKIIPEDRPNVAKIISEIAQLEYLEADQKVTRSDKKS